MKIRRPPTLPLVTVPTAALLASVLFYFSGCVVVPSTTSVAVGSKQKEFRRAEAACGPARSAAAAGRPATAGLDPDRFTLLSWNAHRGSSAGWGEDLAGLGGEVDIVLLQEAALARVIDHQEHLQASEWLMATAFKLADRDIGVLTAARVAPAHYCTIREPEPLIRIPKLGLAAVYPIIGLETELLVVNIHMVNFTLSPEAMRRQAEALQDIVGRHHGPVVVAGDFNTWSDERERLIDDMLGELGLRQVSFRPDNRAEFFAHKVDGIYYRGLEVVRSHSHEVQTSDHNPLEVQFKLASRQASG